MWLSSEVVEAKWGYSPGECAVSQLEALTVAFGGRVALDVPYLRLDGPQLVGLIGRNGSGKTTLLRVLAGLIQPTTGAMTTDGDDVAYVAQRQEQHRWMPLTVAEVLRMGRYRRLGLLGRLGRIDRACIADVTERLEIGHLLTEPFGSLSGGERQRVLIATALAAEAHTLLMDEPITGLDLPSQQIIMDIATEQRDAGRLVVMSTHHLDEARLCDRVLVMSNTIIADGPPDVALEPESLAEAFGRQVVRFDNDAVGGEASALMLDDCDPAEAVVR